MDIKNQPGIFIASIAPLAPLPEEPSGAIVFRVTMRLVISEDQQTSFNIEQPAQGFDEAAQVAYSKVASIFATFNEIAKRASDALSANLSK